MKNTILTLEKQAMERWRSGDPGGFVELSAQDISYIDPGQVKPILGLESFKVYMSQFERNMYYQRSEFIDPRVVVIEDAALLSYNYRSSVLSSEGLVANQTPWNATEVYFRQKGQWRIVHTHWSFRQHILPAEVEVPVPMERVQQEYVGVLGELMRLESAAMERWRKGDPQGFIELYAPQVTYFDTGTPQRLNGLEAMRAEMAEREGKIHYDVMEFIDPRVHLQGNLAVLFYRFFSTTLKPDGSVASRIPWNCTEVYTWMDGNWWIIHNHWSFIRGHRG